MFGKHAQPLRQTSGSIFRSISRSIYMNLHWGFFSFETSKVEEQIPLGYRVCNSSEVPNSKEEHRPSGEALKSKYFKKFFVGLCGQAGPTARKRDGYLYTEQNIDFQVPLCITPNCVDTRHAEVAGASQSGVAVRNIV